MSRRKLRGPQKFLKKASSRLRWLLMHGKNKQRGCLSMLALVDLLLWQVLSLKIKALMLFQVNKAFQLH